MASRFRALTASFPAAALAAALVLVSLPGAAYAAEADWTATLSSGSVLLRLAAAFGGGVLLSLTPCVYPMMFITAAIVAGREKRGMLSALAGSFAYVLGLSIVYALAGLAVASAGAKVRFALDSWIFRVPVALIFIVLALSMFDVLSFSFGEALGGSLRSKLAGKGGLIGIFALGAVSALVASPCLAAPLAAVLTYIATTGDKLLGFLMLFCMAWGMGVILIVAGTFTGLLPKAGEWMDRIKKLLGFVLLWAAVYFLSPVVTGLAGVAFGDAFYRVATGAILIAAAAFIGALDRLAPEAGSSERLRVAAGMIAVVLGAFLIWSGLGWSGGPGGASPAGLGGGEDPVWRKADAAAATRAIGAGRPVVMDFHTGSCIICRELDEKTLHDPRVLSRLVVFTALKVDADDEQDFFEKYGFQGVPSVIFFDASGRETGRFSGFMSPEDFLKRLDAAEGKTGAIPPEMLIIPLVPGAPPPQAPAGAATQGDGGT